MKMDLSESALTGNTDVSLADLGMAASSGLVADDAELVQDEDEECADSIFRGANRLLV